MRFTVVCVALLTGLIACNDRAHTTALPNETTDLSRIREQVLDAALRRFGAAGQTITIGILDDGLTSTSARVLVKRLGDAPRIYSAFLADEWRFGSLGQLIPRGAEPVQYGYNYEPIAKVRDYDSGEFWSDIHHEIPVFAGSYVEHAYGRLRGGSWIGGIEWVADSLFEFNFTRWRYLSSDYLCNFGLTTSTNPSTSFLTQVGGNWCPATEVHLWYSVSKEYVNGGGGGGGGGGTLHWATIVGPSEMRPSDTCHWYASTNVSGAVYQWSVNGITVGSSADLYYSTASNFTLDLLVWNSSSGAGAEDSRSITVSSTSAQCFDQ